MILTLARVLDWARFVSPFLLVWLSGPIIVIVTWRVTLALCKRDFRNWMVRNGDAMLRGEIEKLEAALSSEREYVADLRKAYAELVAQIRAATIQQGRVIEILTLANKRAPNKSGGR